MSRFNWIFLLHVFQTVHDCSAQCVKSLLRNKKELCSVDLELPPRESRSLTEVGHANNRSTTLVKIKRPGANGPCVVQIHYVCLPRLCEEDDISQQVSLIHVPVSDCGSCQDLNCFFITFDL